MVDNISSQERDDFALANAEYHSALTRYERIRDLDHQLQPEIRRLDPSAFLAWLQLEASTNVLRHLKDHYSHIRAAVLSNLVVTPAQKRDKNAPSSPTDSEYFSASGSRPVTPVKQHNKSDDVQDGSFSTPSCQHRDPHYLQQDSSPVTQPPNMPVTPTPPPPGQPRYTPVTPTPPPPGQFRNAPVTPAPLPTQRSSAPSTPLWHLSSSRSTGSMSPFPNQKHYSVARGRRVGVYSGWNHVKPLIEGLGGLGSQQGFDSYAAAVYDYLEARERGYVRVIRLPSDSEAQFGSVEFAEDLPFT